MEQTQESPQQQPQQSKSNKGKKTDSVHESMRQLEQKYRDSRKDWKSPSSVFKAQQPRFSKTREPVQASYEVTAGSIEGSRSGSASPWGKDKSPQRPVAQRVVCDVMYDPRDQVSSPSARSAFSSCSPKYPEAPKRSPGQDKLVLAESSVSPARSPTGKDNGMMRTKSPRFRDPKVIVDKMYDQRTGTIEEGTKAKAPSAWSKNKQAQRPEPSKPLVDKFYDARDVNAVLHNSARPAFVATSPRFPEEKERAPPVGQYTSELISAGMLPS
jgi:hypothetical protein